MVSQSLASKVFQNGVVETRLWASNYSPVIDDNVALHRGLDAS